MTWAVAVLCSIAWASPPLERAHAHNDHRHARPLLDALEHGFCSVEVDVFLADGELRVGDDRREARPGWTLEKLYLDPLAERVARNGGWVHREGVPFTLLVDIKAEGEKVYSILKPALEARRVMLTRFEGGTIVPGPVTVLLSGDRPRRTLESESRRLAAMDGRLPDLDGGAARSLIPLVSDSWPATIRWIGVGRIPESSLGQLRQAVRKAHAQGRRLRFWGTPDTPSVWRLLLEEGVDLIGTNDLGALRDFLSSHPMGLAAPQSPQGISGGARTR